MKSIKIKLQLTDLKEMLQLIYITLEPFSTGKASAEQMILYLHLVSVKDKIAEKLVKKKDKAMNTEISFPMTITEAWAIDRLFTDLNTYHQQENPYWMVLSREFYQEYRRQLEDMVLTDTIQSMRNLQ